MNKNVFYVYEHWRPDTGKCFYVGKGNDKRAWNMTNRNVHHKAIQKKLREMGMIINVVMVVKQISEETAFSVERDLIANYGIKNLANMSEGGEGKTGQHSTEHSQKISDSLRGKKKSQNVIDAVIASNRRRKGIPHPPRKIAHMANLSASLKGRIAPNQKPVVCINDGMSFPSATAAALFYGIKSTASVTEVCNGNRKKTGKMIFEYKGAT